MDSVSNLSPYSHDQPVSPRQRVRLSIVVPYFDDVTLFEASLISVLECRPEYAEVIVSHNGDYDDPFDLCDEVLFAKSVTDDLVDLVEAGTEVASGRYIHVIGQGLQATSGWADAAIEKFEHLDGGSVAPVVRDQQSETILSAGWYDEDDQLAKPYGRGQRDVDGLPPQMIGAHLNGGFWRKDLLVSLHEAYESIDETDAMVAYELLARQAGWRCLLAAESEIRASSDAHSCSSPSFGRGQVLRSLKGHFRQQGRFSAFTSAISSTLKNMARPRLLMESIGQAFAGPGIAQFIDADCVARCDDRQSIIEFPGNEKTSSPTSAMPNRRAA